MNFNLSNNLLTHLIYRFTFLQQVIQQLIEYKLCNNTQKIFSTNCFSKIWIHIQNISKFENILNNKLGCCTFHMRQHIMHVGMIHFQQIWLVLFNSNFWVVLFLFCVLVIKCLRCLDVGYYYYYLKFNQYWNWNWPQYRNQNWNQESMFN